MVEKWNTQRFTDEVLRTGKLAAVEFYSDGGPLRQGFGKAFDSVAERFSGKMLFGKIDVCTEEALAEKYAVRSVPTMMVFCQGRGVAEIVGDADGQRLASTIDSALDRVGGYGVK